MPKRHIKCITCHHPQRHDFEMEISAGARLRAIARKYGVQYHALRRHWINHVTDEEKQRYRFGDVQVERLKGMLVDRSVSVIQDLDFGRLTILETLGAIPVQDAHARATIVGRLHENVRIRAQLNGELANSPLVVNQTNNIAVLMRDPSFAQFQSELVGVLERHPDALRDVIAHFERIETQDTQLITHDNKA